MKKTLITLCAALLAVTSCGSKGSGDTAGEAQAQDTQPQMTATDDNSPRPRVQIETSLGTIVVELYNETPLHRDNMLKLVSENYYDGVLFHRVIKQFMIQTGDGNSKNATPDQMLGSGDPGYTIEAEIVYPKLFHKRGALAAARTGDQVNPERRSSGSQFYIVTGNVIAADEISLYEQRMNDSKKAQIFQNLAMERQEEIRAMYAKNDTAALNTLQNELIAAAEAQAAGEPFKFTQAQVEAYTTVGGAPHLDGQYTVFGEVVEGMDVVAAIENVETGRADRPKTDIKIISMKAL